MRRLNITTALSIAGDATSGAIQYRGFTTPTVTQLGTPNADVTLAEDGGFTLGAGLEDTSETVVVRVEEDGYAIEGAVAITGDGAGVNYTQIGMNLGGINYYNGLLPFANVCWNMNAWTQASGSGAWTQDQGKITAAVGTDVFSGVVSAYGVGMYDGTYTVYNPDGCEIAIGHGGSQTAYKAWTTETEFTISYNPSGGDMTSGANGLYLYAKGSVTNDAGPIAIILPGHTTSWAAGNVWNADCLSYLTALNPAIIRPMDWMNASTNFEVHWSDRTLPGQINIISPSSANMPVVPHEYLIDLANRLDADIWPCISPRVTDDYLEQCAALYASELNPGLKVWPEPGNEPWNFDSPWLENANWIAYLNHTKFVATANPGPDSWTLAGHGLVDGQQVKCFSSRADFAAGNNPDYHLRNGITCYVEYIDADTFQLRQDSAVGSIIPVYPLAQELVFVDPAEMATDANGNFADLCVRWWDAFDTAMGVERVKHHVASQAANPNVTTQRFAGLSTENKARAEAVAVAPYYNGPFFGALVVTDSGQFSPRFWSNTAGTWHFAVYATGATKTIAEIIDGTGAIDHQVVADPQEEFWDIGTGAATVGVSNGTSYKVYFVFTHTGSGRRWKMGQEVVATASHTLVEFHDSFANQSLRGALDAIGTNPTDHIAASGGKELIFYEYGLDLNAIMPDEMEARRSLYQESAECGESLRLATYIRTLSGVTTNCYFADAGSSTFSLANSYADTADERYQVYEALAGRVAVRSNFNIPDLLPDPLDTEPGAYPHTVLTLEAGYTYTILKGNDEELFDISGTSLRLLSDPGIDWAGKTGYSLNLAVNDGFIVETMDIYVTLGSSWRQADAVVDIDYVNDRVSVNGTDYASFADAVTAGAIVLSGGVYRVDLTGLLESGFSFAAKGTTHSATVVGQNARYMAALDDATTSNLIYLTQFNDSGTAKLISAVIRSGTDQTSGAIKTDAGAGTSTPVRIAGRYGANDVAVSFNGATVVRDDTVTMPTVTQLVVGNRHDGTRAWLGSIDRIVVVNDMLGNGILQTLLE